MSETDSFIDEVSEEVRRDQLYGVFKKYAWIAGGLVVLIVGAAAFNEWNKSNTRSTNQAAGDSILAALENDSGEERINALSALEFEDAGKQALVKLQEAALLVEEGRRDEAQAVYEVVAGLEEASPVYRDLAKLKLLVMAPDADGASALIDELAEPGRAFRLLAIEQRALASIRAGDQDAAIADFSAILLDNQATADIRERAQRMIVVLGGEPPQTPRLITPEGDG